MTKLYYNDGEKNICVAEVLTNQSITVDELLELAEFHEASFCEQQGYDDIDYNMFFIE